MPRKRTKARRRNDIQRLKPCELAYLKDDATDITGNNFQEMLLSEMVCGFKEQRTNELWEKHKSKFLPAYIKLYPGRRPYAWWQFDSPGLRERVGGSGAEQPEFLRVSQTYSHGIPDLWFSALDAEIWPKWADHAVDPEDLPKFEAEATFLKRHKLLTPTEIKRLTGQDFEPEEIELDDSGLEDLKNLTM